LAEELRISPSASLAWDCAGHWDAAEDSTRAWELTALIVDQLLALGLPKDAADLCCRAERYCRSREQRAERLLRLSRAYRLLYDWDAVVNSLEERRATLAGGRPRLPRYSDDEITVFEAKWWRDCDGRVLHPTLKRVLDTRAPTLHRLQMAVLALVVADNYHRQREAERIADVVESLRTTSVHEDIEKLKARLVFHTAFGNLESAVQFGTVLVQAERRRGNSTALFKALRWLSLPLCRLDDLNGAVHLLREAYDRASRLDLRGEMWNAAYSLAGVALDCEELSLAQEWAPVVASLAQDATARAMRELEHHYTRARIELMRDDLDRARYHLDQSSNLRRAVPLTRAEQSVLALEVLVRARCAESRIPQAILRRLHWLHIRTRDSGVWDFETASLVAGLLYAGNRSEANTLNAYYMSVRRSRITTCRTLKSVQRLLQADGVA
jgi:hypothetical protein